MDIDQSLKLAAEHQDQGRLDEAEALYRQVLAIERDPDALHLLGLIEQQRGRHGEALPLLQEAVEADAECGEFWYAMGCSLEALGRSGEAIGAFDRAAGLDRDSVEMQIALGAALLRTGAAAAGGEACRRAMALGPRSASGCLCCGKVFAAIGWSDEAAAAYSRAIQFEPHLDEAYTLLGMVLREQGKLAEAAEIYARGIKVAPRRADLHNNLGSVLNELGRQEEAATAFSRAIELAPEMAEAHYNLGTVWHARHKLDEAGAAFSRAIALKPDLVEGHNNLGNVFKDQGQPEQALACFDRALALTPNDASLHSNRIFLLHFHPAYDAAAILREQRVWEQRHAEPLRAQIRPHQNDRSPGRRLRIGYVSPNFSGHVVGRNIVPLLRDADGESFEIICYDNAEKPDEFTPLFRGWVDSWRSIGHMNSERVAELIRADRIDILVDLALHLSRNRLLVFARKPAPVQVTFAGYPAGTGLTAIDYRLTDPYLDPPGEHDDHYVERSIRLPETFWCYDPRAMGVVDLPLSPPPMMSNGFVTFGCLNNFTKINDGALALWARVLAAVPRSRLLLLDAGSQARARASGILARHGIAADRLELASVRPREQYLRIYHRIDIGLDAIPYNGHTSSLDSLWMGVPVITRIGELSVGRAGFSQSCNLGLKELAAGSDDEFVSIAVALANDAGRLVKLRPELRQRMLASPLTDARRFTRNVEAAYRAMWETWCATWRDSR